MARDVPSISLLITGSRTWDEPLPIIQVLEYFEKKGRLTIFEGGAEGADSIAKHYALQRARYGVSLMSLQADWGREGVAAGPNRNNVLLDWFKFAQDMGHRCSVFAFPKKGSKGTIDMINKAKLRGFTVFNQGSIGVTRTHKMEFLENGTANVIEPEQ